MLVVASATLLPCTGTVLGAETNTKLRRVGILLFGMSLSGREAQAFREGICSAGYTEDRDISLQWRTAEGDPTRLPKLLDELLDGKLDCLVVESTIGALAAQR